METEYCEFIHSVRLLDQTAFCAQGDGKSGNQGDPFVVKGRGPNRTSPVYVIGLDAVHIRGLNPGIFMNLYPYVEWINDLINGKITDPAKNSGNRISMEFESSKSKIIISFLKIEKNQVISMILINYSKTTHSG